MPHPITLYVDADACPVKQEVYRVAERFARRGTALKVVVVSNSPIAVPRDDFIERVVVGAGMDEADNYIAERAGRGDVVITADVPLAARAVKAGARGDRAERQGVHRGRHRHDARHPQPDERSAQRRRHHRRAEAVRGAATARAFSRRSMRRWCGSCARASGMPRQRAAATADRCQRRLLLAGFPIAGCGSIWRRTTLRTEAPRWASLSGRRLELGELGFGGSANFAHSDA